MYTPLPKDKYKFWLKLGESLPTIPLQEMQKKKRLLVMAMDINGIAFWDMCEEKTTMNAERYKNFLEKHIPVWMAKTGINEPIIAHDNAKPHIAKLITSYLEQNNISTWIQAPYSPDTQPCDFNCFGPLKRELKGIRYNGWPEFIDAVNTIIRESSKRGLFKGVKMLPDRWKRIVDINGEYI